MSTRAKRSTAVVLVIVAAWLVADAAPAAEIKVMNSGGFSAAYRALTPQFEQASGHTLSTAWGPSMGNTPEAIPVRLTRGEPAEVVIMVGYALDDLIAKGKVVADSRVDLARSGIGVAVRAGAPKPDIGSVDALKRALITARSIAYSDSASGVYVSTELFRRLGIAERMASKSRMIPAEPVAAVVARGDSEIGFQQMSELLPVPGIEIVGPLPPEVQKVTVFSAGVVAGAKEPDAAKSLIAFLASEAAAPAITRSGLEPITSAPR
jgi:molybdate transport system substrate-binding protein